MALTATQKQKARDYLGIPSITSLFRVGNQGPDLSERLDALSAESELRVVELLDAIDTSRTDITAARGRLKAEQVGDIKLNQRELKDRWREDYLLCRQLAVIVGMEVYDHPSRPKPPEVIA